MTDVNLYHSSLQLSLLTLIISRKLGDGSTENSQFEIYSIFTKYISFGEYTDVLSAVSASNLKNVCSERERERELLLREKRRKRFIGIRIMLQSGGSGFHLRSFIINANVVSAIDITVCEGAFLGINFNKIDYLIIPILLRRKQLSLIFLAL